MKKILSLLAMLMITVMAFATDYKGQLDYAIKIYSNSYPASIAEGTLSITQYDNGNYQVTAKDCNIPGVGDFGNVVCDGLSGTTDANGVTTIDVTDCTAGLDGSAWTDLSSTKLLVKFNKDKAYATFEGKYQVGVWRTVSYTFGTDDFGSTGGGETGGETKEKYTVNFDKGAKSTHSGRVLNSFSLQQTGKEKQTESVSALRAAYEDHTAKKFTVEAGSELTASFNYKGEWMNGYVYIDRDNDGEFSYKKGQWDQAGTDLVAYSFYTTLDNPKVNDGNGYNSTGTSVTGDARSNVNPPAFTAPTEPGTYRIRFKVDWNCILPGGSNDILSDGGGVWDATLEVVAPAPTVAETFTYDQDAFVGPNDTNGTANVKVYKMTDDSYTMEITAPVATKVGVITVGEDAKGRTTYMGEVESSVVDGVKYVVNGVVYEEGGAKHLYMTLAHDDDTYIIGENPDAPKVVSTLPFENVAYTTSYNESGNTTVTFTEMSDGTHPMTFVSEAIKATADNLTKGTDAKGRTTYTGEAKRTDTSFEVKFAVKAVVYGEPDAQKLYMTMDNGSGFIVTVGEDPDAPKVKVEKTFTDAFSLGNMNLGNAKVAIKEMSDETINMVLTYSTNDFESNDLVKGTDDKNRTTYTGTISICGVECAVSGVVYTKDNVEKLYMTFASTTSGTYVFGTEPTDTPEVTESSNKTYTSNLRIFDGEEPVVENANAQVNIIKYSDESYKVTLKNVNMLNKTQDLVFVGKALIEEAPIEATEPLTIIAKSDEATTAFFGEEMNGTFEITEVSAEEIKMGFVLNNTSLEYQGEFNYTEEETPEVYTNNLHIYDAAAPETDLFQADQAKVEFLATETGGFKLTLKDVTLNEKTQDLVFTGTLPTPQPGGQDPLAEEGETTPAEPAMVLNAIADEATATFLGATSATAVFNVIMNDEAETENDAFALTFAITAGEKTLGGEFNYEKTPDVEEYPINFDKTAKSTHNSRALNSFSLQQTGKDKQTKSVKTSKAAYEDHTADEPFTVEAGSELTASFDYTGEWMHSFVYIDFDNDGDFSYKEGQWDQTGTDLVAFSFYSLDSNPKNDASGYNSVGDELTGDARNTYVAPSFKAPAKAGEYRIRFKFDWNCILPGGSSSILSDGGGVWDATLKVVEPVVDGISSINAEVANGEAQLFTVNGIKLNKLQKGLNIVRTADGKVKKVLVK